MFRMMQSTSSSLGLFAFLLLVLLCCCNIHVAQATITVVDTGKSVDSVPEKHVGSKLWKGYDYIGHLQYVQGNVQLCKNTEGGVGPPYTIPTPPDGLPVALLAKTGGCTLEEKALVASTMVEPANLVAYLIVDDYGAKKKKKKTSALRSEEEEEEYDYDAAVEEEGGPFWAVQSTTDEDAWVKSIWESEEDESENGGGWLLKESSYVPSDDEAVKFVQGLGEEDTVIVSDDETLPPMPDDVENDDLAAPPLQEAIERYATFVTLNDDATSIHEDEEPPQQHRVLKRHKKSSDNNINVAVLHVSQRSGFQLFDVVVQQDTSTYKAGGPKIILNNKAPSSSAKEIFLWTMLSIFCIGGLCCCIMVVMNDAILEEPPAPPRRPVRRRLTYDQVRASHPAFRYNPEEHVEAHLDECSICLDDFEAGARCRQLPCNHIFHSACIGRWLIERSATCPLCKIDLYEEEETSDEEEEEQPAEPELPTTREWWRSLGMIYSSAPISSVPAATTNATTTPAAPATTAATVTPTTNNTTTGSSSSSSFSWWPTSRIMNSRSSRPRDGDDNTTRESRPRRGGIWRLNFFGRPNRRREGEGMLTELTEPLIAAGGESQPAEQQLPQTTTATTSSSSSSLENPAASQQQQPETASMTPEAAQAVPPTAQEV